MPAIYKDGKWYTGDNSGHLIKDNGTDLYPREALNFVGFDTQDDSVNAETKIKEHRLTAQELKELIGTPPSKVPTVFADNAGYHNSLYRGKYLGDHYTDEQKAAVASGLFTDMFIGDFWIINSRVYRIAAFDYWLTTGDTPCTDHHVLIVPDVPLYDAKMNDSNVVTGAYVGSKMYTTYIATARTTIQSDFGVDNILVHREYFSNTVSGNIETNGAWYNSSIDLMTEQMAYGGKVFHNCLQGTTWAYSYVVGKSQLPLFRYRHDLISNGYSWWLRSVADSTGFAFVSSNGNCDNASASGSYGVRPAFAVK